MVQPIYEEVLFFAGTLLPYKKIIVSRKDYQKIMAHKNKYAYSLVNDLHVQIAFEKINNFPRAEFGEKKTNRNFELKE